MKIFIIENTNPYSTVDFQGCKPKVSKKNIIKPISQEILPVSAVAAASLAATALTLPDISELDETKLREDLNNGLSLHKIAEKYNTRVSAVRTFMKKHNLSTSDGKILKTITKEDLEKCISDGMTAKEIAKRYHLGNVGSLTPLFGIFGLTPPTQSKLDKITPEEFIEFKKRGYSDKKISETLNISPQYIRRMRRAFGISPEESKSFREYPMEEIKKLIYKMPLQDVANSLDIPFYRLVKILRENNINIPPQNSRQQFKSDCLEVVNKVKQYKSELRERGFWNSKKRDALRLTPRNIKFYSKILDREDLRQLSWQCFYPSLEILKTQNGVYNDLTELLELIPENNPLYINGNDIQTLIDDFIIHTRRQKDLNYKDKIENLYNYVTTHNIGDIDFISFRKLLSLERTSDVLDRIINDKNLKQHKELLMYTPAKGEIYSRMIDTLQNKPELLDNPEVRFMLSNVYKKPSNVIYTILNDDNAINNIKLLYYTNYAYDKEYIDVLDTFKRKPELLHLPAVRKALRGYSVHPYNGAHTLNAILNNIEEKNLNQVVKYMDDDFVHSIGKFKKFGTMYFLPEYVELNPILANNESIIKHFDAIMHSMKDETAKARIAFLKEVNSNIESLEHSEKLNNLGKIVLSIKDTDDILKQLELLGLK